MFLFCFAKVSSQDVDLRQLAPLAGLVASFTFLRAVKELPVERVCFHPLYALNEARRKGDMGSRRSSNMKSKAVES